MLYCAEAFGSTNGKTARGLMRCSERYHICSVVDPALAGQDAGVVLDGRPRDIPILHDVPAAVAHAAR